MTAYRNFVVDFPKRLMELDQQFLPVAKSADFEVSYILMKLAASFLLPYERIEGTSGARRSEISDPQQIRKYLELDKRFHQASYCSDSNQWSFFDVDEFHRGPRDWWTGQGARSDLVVHELVVHEVLQTIRHSVAHSNLFFGGEKTIEHIFLGSRRERDPNTDRYRVARSSVHAINHLIDAWIQNVQKLRVSPEMIWRELDEAA